MTRYAFDPIDHKLIAAWGTGQGDRASTVTVLDEVTGAAHGLALACTMSILANELWRAYTEPAADLGDETNINSPAWRRARTRESFAEVPEALVNPNLPENGMLLVNYEPVIDSAHQLGRVLHEIGDHDLTATVRLDIEEEIAAIERAECGDLEGRARQAVLLSRPEASPAQVSAADAILREDVLGGAELFTDLDPAASAVAAVHWLYAAALVTGERSGIDPTNVVKTADVMQALPYRTPTLVLEQLADGRNPYSVVVSLIRDAAAVAKGVAPDIDALIAELAEFSEAQGEADEEGEDGAFGADDLDEAQAGLRLTPLNPARAALDLLEDLLTGIFGCFLVFKEYAGTDDLYTDGDEDADEEAYRAWNDRIRAEFRTLVGRQAQTMRFERD